MRDAVCDATFVMLWRNRASRNTLYFEKNFPHTRRFTAMYTDEELATLPVVDRPQGFVVSFAAQFMKTESMLPMYKMVMPLNVFQ